jgi:hypothetical protein
MKNAAWASLILACSGFLPSTFAHERPQPPGVSLTVSVFNDAGVDPSVLSPAQTRATDILRHSGISLTWLDCGSPASRILASNCSSISYPAHLSVRVVPKVSPMKGDIFGQSFQDASGEGNYVLVYYPGIKAFRAATTVPTGELLGCVIAHELGHLLLGTASHSSAGLMSAVWQDPQLQQATRGNLFFSSDEGERMRFRFAVATSRLRKFSVPQRSGSGN